MTDGNGRTYGMLDGAPMSQVLYMTPYKLRVAMTWGLAGMTHWDDAMWSSQ